MKLNWLNETESSEKSREISKSFHLL